MIIDLELARRLEYMEADSIADYAHTQLLITPEIGPAVLAVGGGLCVFTGPGSPVSGVIGLGLDQPLTHDHAHIIEQFFSERGGTIEISVCPLADASVWTILRERGYSLSEFRNIYVRSPQPPSPLPAHVSVTLMSPEQYQLWVTTIAGGFAGTDNITPDDIAVAMPMAKCPGVGLLIAWIDDQPAGASAFEVRYGLTRIFSMSTRTQFRRRGVQTALLSAHRMYVGESDLETVEAVPGTTSDRVISQAGFQLAYTRAVLAPADSR